MASLAYAVNESSTVINLEQKRAEYMGNPQLDDGFVRIANELYEAINRFSFSGRQQKVMYAVIRKTYGFGKKSDVLAQSQIAEMTGLAKPNVCRTIKELLSMKAIEIDSTSYTHTISINKKYNEWTSYQNDSYQNDNETVIKTITKPLSKRQQQKKERKKDNCVQVPEWIPGDSWFGFVEMRKAIKKPMTDRAMAMVIKKLSAFRDEGYSPAEILDQSTLKNWQDVFATKTKPVVTDDPSAMVTLPNGKQITRARQQWLLEMTR
jgi:phage replication O-like protein O